MKTALKKTLFAVLILGGLLNVHSETIVYKMKMSLKIPRVYDNSRSLGYRKNQRQKIECIVYVDKDLASGQIEPAISVCNAVNKTHKTSSGNVTYGDCEAEDVTWRYIGSNKTGVFKNANIKFSLDLNPSYNIGDDEPDNTLLITLSGLGASDRIFSGHVTGNIGCGCKAYGHKSPTRTISCLVSDVVPVSGTFTMRRIGVCR